jgi:hypothetical protein
VQTARQHIAIQEGVTIERCWSNFVIVRKDPSYSSGTVRYAVNTEDQWIEPAADAPRGMLGGKWEAPTGTRVATVDHDGVLKVLSASERKG